MKRFVQFILNVVAEEPLNNWKFAILPSHTTILIAHCERSHKQRLLKFFHKFTKIGNNGNIGITGFTTWKQKMLLPWLSFSR